jgi:hypothetical protein
VPLSAYRIAVDEMSKESSCFVFLFLQLARVDGLSIEGPYENEDNAPGKREGRKTACHSYRGIWQREDDNEVIVAAEPDENDVRKLAIARARDFARKFALDSV